MLTPPAREDKRKKQKKTSEAETFKKPPQPQRQSTKQAPGPESEPITKTREEAQEGTREAEEEREQRKAAVQSRSRTSSTSLEKSLPGNITKQVGITVYVRKTSTLNTTSRDPHKREEVRRAIIKGEAKITWRNPKAERQSLIQAFSKNKIDLEEIEYRRVENSVFEKIIVFVRIVMTLRYNGGYNNNNGNQIEDIKIIQHNVHHWSRERAIELGNYYRQENPDVILLNSTGMTDRDNIKIDKL